MISIPDHIPIVRREDILDNIYGPAAEVCSHLDGNSAWRKDFTTDNFLRVGADTERFLKVGTDEFWPAVKAATGAFWPLL